MNNIQKEFEEAYKNKWHYLSGPDGCTLWAARWMAEKCAELDAETRDGVTYYGNVGRAIRKFVKEL
jgi:hypothetical protein